MINTIISWYDYCQQLFLTHVNIYYKPVFPHSSLFVSTHQKPQKPHDI